MTSDKEEEGTTAAGITFAHGAMASCESRCSNERATDNSPERKLKIQDDWYKVAHVSDKIIGVMVGNKNKCQKLASQLRQSILETASTNNTGVLVEYAINVVKDTCSQLREENRSFGVLVAGYDQRDGYQIFSGETVDGKINYSSKGAENVEAGSGSAYAKKVLDNFNPNMSVKEAESLMAKAIFDATFRSRHSGGDINVVHITNNRHYQLTTWDILDTYHMFYNEYSKFTFFVVYKSTEQLTSNAMKEHFGEYGEVEYAHQVAVRGPANNEVCFHRLVFKDEKGDSNLSKVVENNNGNSHGLFSRFSYSMSVNEVPLFVAKASIDLLEFFKAGNW